MAASPHLIQIGACSRDPRIFQAINIHHGCTGANEFPALTTGASELGPVLEYEAALNSSSEIVTREPKKGKEVGWIYGSVTEVILTGFKMHCHGWRSILSLQDQHSRDLLQLISQIIFIKCCVGLLDQ
jgi:hypothetical protein